MRASTGAGMKARGGAVGAVTPTAGGAAAALGPDSAARTSRTAPPSSGCPAQAPPSSGHTDAAAATSSGPVQHGPHGAAFGEPLGEGGEARDIGAQDGGGYPRRLTGEASPARGEQPQQQGGNVGDEVLSGAARHAARSRRRLEAYNSSSPLVR